MWNMYKYQKRRYCDAYSASIAIDSAVIKRTTFPFPMIHIYASSSHPSIFCAFLPKYNLQTVNQPTMLLFSLVYIHVNDWDCLSACVTIISARLKQNWHCSDLTLYTRSSLVTKVHATGNHFYSFYSTLIHIIPLILLNKYLNMIDALWESMRRLTVHVYDLCMIFDNNNNKIKSKAEQITLDWHLRMWCIDVCCSDRCAWLFYKGSLKLTDTRFT